MKTVLLVDSDLARAEAFGRALQAAGASVATSPDGEKALARARVTRPDLFVVASALPDMSGFSLCNRLRRAPGLSDVPVVLVPGVQDAAATEAHRASKTPASDYLPQGAPPDELVRRAASLVGMGPSESTEELAAEDLVDMVESPPMATPPGLPPSQARSSGTLGGARPRLVDPFSEAAPEPRSPMGGSPDEKLTFFRDRVKAKDELLTRAKQAFGQARELVESMEVELAGLRSALAQTGDGKRVAEGSLAQATQELSALRAQLEAALAGRAEALERSQSLSELTNETLRDRERADKDAAARLAEADQRLKLLQEEAEHLATENERLGGESSAQAAELARLQAELADEQARASKAAEELSGAKIEGAALQGELEASRQEIDAERARSAAILEDLESERAQAQAASTRLVELEGALEGTRAVSAELNGELDALRARLPALERERDQARIEAKELSAKLAAAGASARSELELAEQERLAAEQRAGETASELSEVRGQLEALQEADREWQSRAASLEGRIVQLESELSSRDEECAGLRSELTQTRGGREQMQDELSGQMAGLAQELHERDGKVTALTQQLQERDGKIAALMQQLAQAQAAKAAPPAPASAPAATDKELSSLRVRLSDMSAELKALRAKAPAKAPAAGGDEARLLRGELDAARSQNRVLKQELDRLRAQLGDDTTIEIDLAK
ncbi:MAG: response regulator [Deltaproteobacteria bacterium]